MAEVRPFRALRYNPAKVGDLSPILCPPYDIISTQGREDLYRQSPFNVVRLEFGRPEAGDGDGGSVYSRAAASLGQWLDEGVLTREDGPVYYLVTEEYLRGGATYTRTGLYGAVHLEEYERGIILPHEQTRPGPKEDRLRLMEACHAVFSPLMALYRDPGGLRTMLAATTTGAAPDLEATEGAVQYRLWTIRDPAAVSRIEAAFASTPVYMGDGHHRYETALTYRDARRSEASEGKGNPGYDYALICLIDMEDPGFQLLSFHRLLHGLSQGQIDQTWQRVRAAFTVEGRGALDPSEAAMRDFLGMLEEMSPETPTFGLLDVVTMEAYSLTLQPDAPSEAVPTPSTPLLGRCETWLLHQAVLDPVIGAAADEPEQISFLHGLGEVAEQVASGAAQMVFFVRPLDLGLFEELVRQGQRLPPKTTYFSPKLPTGLVMHVLDGEL
jgi:uncharacterized protein (DUF1015 family)